MHAEMFAEVPFALFCKLALILTLLRLQRRRHCRFRQYLFIGMLHKNFYTKENYELTLEGANYSLMAAVIISHLNTRF